MDLLKNKIFVLKQRGLIDIFGTSIINKIIAFISNAAIIRILSQQNYGYLTYSNNIIQFFLLFSGIGLSTGILQFCSENRLEKDKNKLYKFGFEGGFLFNIILTIAIIIYSSYGPLTLEESRSILLMLSFLPNFEYMYSYLSIFLRTKKENKKYARLLNINSISYMLFSLLGAYLYGVKGNVLGRYISLIITIFIGLIFIKEDIKVVFKSKIPKKRERITLLKYSIITCLNNGISQMLYLLDVFIIGIIVKDSSVIAVYKTATLIPFTLYFIPINIMIFIYPYFAENKDNIEWIKRNTYKLIGGLAIFNAIITIILYIMSPLIIMFLFGKEYTDALIPFKVLCISYFFSATFRIPGGNILAMMRKVNVNFVISILSGMANVILDIYLISEYGSVGAALATLLVIIISGILSIAYISIYFMKARSS